MNNTKEDKIYLLKTNILNDKCEPSYKIGRTAQSGIRRFYNYDNKYELLYLRRCKDSIQIESKILNVFKKKYSTLFKNEYFCGDSNEMIKDIHIIIDNENENENDYDCILKQNIHILEIKPETKLKSVIQHDNLLIKIKSFIKNDRKVYYITDDKNKVLHYVWNTNHMEWILGNDFDGTDRFENPIELIKENIFYNINDFHIFDSIIQYTDSGLGINLKQENINKIELLIYTEKNYFSNEHDGLSVYEKIVYLFECDTEFDNINGGRFLKCKYCCNKTNGYDYNLYVYSNLIKKMKYESETTTSNITETHVKYDIEYDEEDDAIKCDEEFLFCVTLCRFGNITFNEKKWLLYDINEIEPFWEIDETIDNIKTNKQISSERNLSNSEKYGSSIIKKLLLDYEITNLDEDYVTSSDLQEWIDEKKLSLTMKKFGMELKRYCCLRKYENVTNGDKKVNGKKKVVWYGLKKILEYIECG